MHRIGRFLPLTAVLSVLILFLGSWDAEALESSDCEVCVETLIGEAVGEGFEGMVAVGEVIRNRARARGQSYEHVALAPYQFSAQNDKVRLARFIKLHKHKLDQARLAWRKSAFSNLTQGSDHYHATYVNPYWADSMIQTVQIGNHKFYRSR